MPALLPLHDNARLHMCVSTTDSKTKFWQTVLSNPPYSTDHLPSDFHLCYSLKQYCAGDKIEKNEMGGACSAYGGGERRVQGFGVDEGKRPLGRPRHRWVDNIKMELQEVGCGGMDWIGLAQDRDRWRALVDSVRNLRAP